MLIDQVDIEVRAGKGGDGAVSFRHEKYVEKGGPDGGDGGDGGDVILKCAQNVDSLRFFSHQKEFSAQGGGNGAKNKRHGKNGENLILTVPPGTQVIDLETNKQIADLKKCDDTFVVAKGGKGGLGNVHFASATHQTPREFKAGERGEEKKLRLEMKLIADVGLIGLPNAGKSTLISAISSARPKVADYPFTTLEPNLGVVSYDDKSFIVCDIPGLIEGASEGKGLGHKFLKHVERTNVLVHLIDATSADTKSDYQKIRKELENFSNKLTQKKELVVLTKADLVSKLPKDFKYDLAISAVSGKNIKQLICKILENI
ncbi:MAG: GTPase Obg [candidate division WS2 bacterium ADurb.Bin280]|uniref:GTPase Obg n=1 Tax=candidate division WS2 bacterium ADurb.Bin280 TaxID=1852829 RepID=A0A1V5SFL5_9BACT|nr:MAG: GTPase Obg [candidate division WS2 bacterium ADurb.Bin280]